MSDSQSEQRGGGARGDGVRLARGFLAGELDAVREVAKVVGCVVRDKAYAVPDTDREDLAQQTLVDLYRRVSSPEFVPRREFAALVRTVAYCRCIDFLRRRRDVQPFEREPLDPRSNPHDLVDRRQRAELGRRLLGELSEICQQVIRLRIVDELPHQAIAERLGRSDGGVRNLLSKCLQQARRRLKLLVPQRGRST